VKFLDVSRNNFLLNSQKNDTKVSTIRPVKIASFYIKDRCKIKELCSRRELTNIQSAENYNSLGPEGDSLGFSETVRQLPDIEDYKF